MTLTSFATIQQDMGGLPDDLCPVDRLDSALHEKFCQICDVLSSAGTRNLQRFSAAEEWIANANLRAESIPNRTHPRQYTGLVVAPMSCRVFHRPNAA